MKYMIVISMFLTACAQGSNDQSSHPAIPIKDVACTNYNTCTYAQNGWVSIPVYDCKSITIYKSDASGVPENYFGASDCLTYAEDYQNGIQGPGQLAIPDLGL